MEPAGEKEALIDEIMALEAEIRRFEGKQARQKAAGVKLASLGGKVFLYAFLGRHLTRSLGRLIVSVGEEGEPIFGPSLARTLDAAILKLMGYKRWLLIFGGLAAVPGMISVALLWQQNLAVGRETDNTVADAANNERLRFLQLIYSTYDKTESGLLTTPVISAANRRDAVLHLIDRDAVTLAETEERTILNNTRMVDISVAPLNGIDFSPLPGETQVFREVSFTNSNFQDSSFENCEFEQVWFSNAILWNTNFRGAVCRRTFFDEARILGVDFRETEFLDCDFSGALFDEETRWPEGFDPFEAGARPFPKEPEGN